MPIDEQEGLPERSAPEEGSSKPRRSPKGSGKGRRWAFRLFALLLLLGAGIGLNVAGVWDMRPYVYPVVPKIPFVGKPLASIMGIPAVYSMTVAERRRQELEAWEQRLNDREKNMAETKNALEALSSDLTARSEAVRKKETALSAKEREKPPVAPAEEKNMETLLRTYQDMSPRKAAQIVEALRPDLAVTLLEKMPEDARAAILGRMEASRAARLTEQLAVQRKAR